VGIRRVSTTLGEVHGYEKGHAKAVRVLRLLRCPRQEWRTTSGGSIGYKKWGEKQARVDSTIWKRKGGLKRDCRDNTIWDRFWMSVLNGWRRGDMEDNLGRLQDNLEGGGGRCGISQEANRIFGERIRKRKSISAGR